MLVELICSCSAALLFVYLFIPSLWSVLVAVEGSLDAHEKGLALVATRVPVTNNPNPACMAKLIMLRHRIHQTSHRKRRSMSQTRASLHAAPRSKAVVNIRANYWMRLGRPFARMTR